MIGGAGAICANAARSSIATLHLDVMKKLQVHNGHSAVGFLALCLDYRLSTEGIPLSICGVRISIVITSITCHACPSPFTSWNDCASSRVPAHDRKMPFRLRTPDRTGILAQQNPDLVEELWSQVLSGKTICSGIYVGFCGRGFSESPSRCITGSLKPHTSKCSKISSPSFASRSAVWRVDSIATLGGFHGVVKVWQLAGWSRRYTVTFSLHGNGQVN